jgi:hypothetical protein
MPPFETMDRHQSALYWAATGRSGRDGQPIVSAPVELTVRWAGPQPDQTERMTPEGNTVAVHATVVLDQPVTVGGIMWQGGFADLPGTASVPEGDLMQVISYSETPDLKNRNFRREATLMRFRDSLPTVG